MKYIKIRNARTHNLCGIDVDIPRDKLTVITGLSGSGKSSLAFDTIFAEGQRRYVESLSTYARQFLARLEKPDVDSIDGLSPAISIEQKSTSHNPRSTVGTVTEVYDYLRLLYARVGTPQCPDHKLALEAQTVSGIVDQLMSLPDNTRIMLLSPVVKQRKGEHKEYLSKLMNQGYIRARINGKITELNEEINLNPKKKHNIEIVIDRLRIREEIKVRLAESIETSLSLGDGVMITALVESNEENVYSSKHACPICDYSLSELEPRLFSFNNPIGACSECDGLGVIQHFDENKIVNEELSLETGAIKGWDKRNDFYFQIIVSLGKHYKFNVGERFKDLSDDVKKIILFGSEKEKIKFQHKNNGERHSRTHTFEGIIPNFERRYKETESSYVREELSKYISQKICTSCDGDRLNIKSKNVFINDKNLPYISGLSIEHCYDFFHSLELESERAEIGKKIINEIISRLQFLVDVGLGYLSLGRSAETLSGGESQRIRLASQIGAGLVGVTYILDEPTIGLHQKDNRRLIDTLNNLRDLGNTVIVVEHDEASILNADHIIDLGPGAGIHGGNIVGQGTAKEIIQQKKSLTGQYLGKIKEIPTPLSRTPRIKNKQLTIKNASGNNLKNICVDIPIGLLTCVTGVSGSGKSTLINDTLHNTVANEINKSKHIVAPCDEIIGLQDIDKIVDINQRPIGRTPRSNPATYTGLFTHIRDLFSGTQEARARGYKAGRFSFNVKGGRCEACRGDGVIRVEMHFLPDIFITCDTCKGQRYNRETLEILYKNKNIGEILEMTVEDAFSFFHAVPNIKRKLQTLIDVGLTYIKIGQNAVTLSGGEAQRIKLSKELSKRDTGKTLYILDEPTTGLHFYDIEQLLKVLHRLRNNGNTIVVIEHNLDVIKTCDWIIDLGPDGGDNGGELIACGTPEELSTMQNSYTGQFLKATTQC